MDSSPPHVFSPVLPAPKPRQSKLKLLAFVSIALLLLSELTCRYLIGLGDPPLYQSDPKMEYVLQPSRTYSRFHNRFSVNRYGMRADDFAEQKLDPQELRVLVIGDSVVYGGVRIDQRDIDTEILKRDLEHEFSRPVVVGNASAKSWGPPNELAYLKRYGTLQADLIILELSSHDYADAPTFVPVVGISAEYPDKRPFSALADLFETYVLPRYFHIGRSPKGIDKTMINAVEDQQDITECRNAEREFFRFARAGNAKIALVQHLTLPELAEKYQEGYYANQQVAKEENVPYLDDAEDLRNELQSGSSPFYPGDPIHLNRKGQVSLAHALKRAVDLTLKSN